jgi:hypothetical protein|nr:MAG TPA: hypothetical protein [Caudoviricetes sp.]
MSFKDAKRKAMATSFEAMTLASDDNGVAVYAGDDYEIVSGYDQYNQYNDEKYSTVDENKNITMDSSQINITQESNSQYIPFKIPRYYDGIDLSEMTICIRYSDKLTGGTPGEYSIVNVKRNSQYICFGWLIDDKLTRSPGEYIFEIRATGQVDNLIYAWSTRPNGKINILQGIDINGAIEPSDSGWMTSFEKKVIEYTKEAKKAATEAKNAATEVNEKLNNIKESVMSEIRDEINNTSSLINYYTKTEIDTQEKSINDSISLLRNAIDNMDGLANLDISYIKANQTLTLLYKDSKKEIAHTVIDIDSLSKLQAKYTTSDGKGVLSFYQKGIEEPITSVELGSIDPSTEWIAANITPINNSIQSIQKQQAENGQKITVLTSSLDKINEADTVRDTKIKTNEDAIGKLKTSVAEIPQLKEDVSQATNTVNNMKQTVDGNKEAVDSLGTNFDNLEGRVKKLEENPASTEYDVDYADNIFYWKENGETVKTFTIQGGGGGGTTTSTMTIERVTPADAIFLLGNKAVIEYTWSSVDNVGDSTGIGTAVWKVDNTTVSTLTVGQGRNSIDLTEFLKTGTNSIRLSITDSVGTLSTKTWTITIVDFKLESSFDDTLFYSDEVSFRYIPYGNINKTVHFILDGVELDSVNTTASGRQLSYVLTKQSHGAHLLKVYMTATVNNQAIQSSTIIKDIIWVNPDERTPIIGCAMQEFTTQQYHATNIPYVVYDPDHNPATVKLAVNGNTVSTLSVNRTVQTWSYKSSDVGSHDLTISCRKVTKILKANIEKLDIDVEPVTANLEFDFNPTGYSNSDTNRLWSDKNHSNIAMTVSDNFDWSNGGYQIDKDGNQYFCVKAGTTVKINYNLFGIDPKQTGSEFKVVFKTTNVRDASATFLSCINKKDANPVGLEMNVHEANIYSSTSSLYFPYSEEDIIEYEFNINALDTKTDGATSIIMTYEDGVGGRPMIYNDVHRLYQYEPLPITIGCDDCDVHIYRMKAYSASLTDTDILANFIADARDADDMIARFERNQIYDENNSLTPESVAKACPDLRIIKIEAPHFTNDKKDFVKNTSMQCIYTNGDPVLDNWKFTNCYHAGQGTTSNEYGFAARNIDVICCFDGEHQVNSKITLDPDYKTILELGDGSKTIDGTGKISLTRNSIPNNWWNFKVNVASSEMTNNALLQKRFNDYLPYSNPATRKDPKVKNSMEFVNCVIFLKESDPDVSTHREFQDTDWHFYSLGNMGDSKKTDVTRAYDPDDMKEFCIEISDNTLPNSAFQTGVINPDGTIKYPITKTEWKTGNTAYDNLYNNWDGSFEFRYDCCGDSKDGTAISTDEVKEKIRTNNRQIWRDFYEFVITSSDEDFVAHLGDWMIEEAAEYLYLFTLRYTMIDNRAKNVFPHWAKHYMSASEAAEAGEKAQYYIIDNSKAAINNGYRFDFWDYDNDTGLGINNSGELTMSYGKEDTDYKTDRNPSSGYIFNAAESVLWCRIRDLMQPQLRNLYQSVNANCWSDTHLINEFDTWQEMFPEELWRLHYERLYLRTYQAGTIRFLQEMMNGRKKYQRRQWERDQHAYMGTKFVHTDVKSDQIMFRCNTPKEAVVKPDYTLRIVPYSDMYISVLYGNSANPTQVRAKAGQEYEITTNLTNMDDTAVLIYCASRIQALNNLSACYIHDNDFSKASKLKTLIIGNDTEGYQNSFLTNLNMGNNVLLEELDVQNCPNLTGSINLSACENLLKLNASGTIISSVSFATHGKITHAYLPATINTLTFKDLQNLTDLVIPSYENLETFICRNSKIDALSIIKKAIKSLKTVTVTGINWNLDNTDILKVLAKLSGKDENEFNTDHSVLTGTIHIPVIRDQELKEYIGTDEQKGIWSNLEVSYDSLIVQYKITCVNADEAHTVLDIQYVDKGADGEDPLTRSLNPIKTPTIPSTVENDFVFKRWDSAFTKIFADRVITAVYDPVIRNYTVEYILKPTLNASETVLQSSTGPFGSTIEYEGETPRYTAEESAFKYYLFKEWDKSGLVTGNKKIYTVFDSCEYTTGYFDGKDLGNLSEVELYTMMKMSLEKEKTKEADTLNFKLGVDYNYDDVESKEFISETTEFDGTNYIDTNTTIMDIDRDFTFAIDFEFDAGNTSGATLAQCFQSNGSNGFRLWYSSNVNLNWGTKSTNPAGIADRELVVIRHKAGSEQAYIYCSNLTGNEVSTTTLSAIRIPVIPSTLVFGCSKADDGEYEKYAKGKIHWAKLWYADLGDGECKDIAAWVHETIPMMVAKYKEYYLSDNTTKRANITFIGKNLLSANCAYGNISGGWAKSSLNSWLNTRLPKAIPPLWKSLIKKVNVIANNADKAKTTSTSECYFYIPSVYEIDPTISGEPYSIETDSTISFMTSDFVRRRAKVSTPNIYEAYPTRSADVDQSPGTWLYGVDGGDDTPGRINGYYYPQTAGVLIMFSISCEG